MGSFSYNSNWINSSLFKWLCSSSNDAWYRKWWWKVDKAEAEDLLLAVLTRHLGALPAGQQVMMKLTLPEKTNLYKSLVDHPSVMRVVALSGGYSREEANDRLFNNTGMIASFSRALTEGLSAGQTDAEFNATIATTIDSIAAASNAG